MIIECIITKDNRPYKNLIVFLVSISLNSNLLKNKKLLNLFSNNMKSLQKYYFSQERIKVMKLLKETGKKSPKCLLVACNQITKLPSQNAKKYLSNSMIVLNFY